MYRTRLTLFARPMFLCLLAAAAGIVNVPSKPLVHAPAATRYYAHDARLDAQGVIAPWYTGQNGQVDWRLRIAAETLKRYPWTTTPSPAPHYVFNGTWRVDSQGNITIPALTNWDNGDLGQRAAYVLSGLVDYYRYTGDPAAVAHIWLTVETLRRYCLTDDRNPWPRILISVPTKGKPYGQADPHGMIQLDIVAEVGIGLVRAYQLVGQEEWWELAKHWADLFAAKRRTDLHLSPWPRYANPEQVPWEDLQTGGVVFILEFLDEVIRLGYTGQNGEVLRARDAGRRFLRDVLLPRWTLDDTWGRNYWDWNDPVQAENVTEFVARYLMAHPGQFPNWRTDVRNILTLFLHRTSVDPGSGGGVFSGAWAFPESSACCGRSLWYGPMELAPVFAELGHRLKDPWASEVARRMMLLATYDAHENGVVEDNIDGGQIVAGAWFKIAHPMALKHTLNAIAWQPEVFGAARENHIVRTTHVLRNVVYGDGRIEYSTFPAPGPTMDVLRLAFRPTAVMADGKTLPFAQATTGRGVELRRLSCGDWIVAVRRDGTRTVVVSGDDPQKSVQADARERNSLEFKFAGNQVRILGTTGPDGGLAEVWLDGAKQLVPIDCWSPMARYSQTLYYRNGLANSEHVIEIKPVNKGNPVSKGHRVTITACQSSAATSDVRCWQASAAFRPIPQRVIFGYSRRRNYVASDGRTWRPATEWIVRLGGMADSVEATWRTTPVRATIFDTADPEIYRYGVHARDLTAFFTVAPGTYTVRMHFMETRRVDARDRLVDIEINGQTVVEGVDLEATGAGFYRAAVLAFPGIRPRSGTIAVRVSGHSGTEAVLQAVEILPGYAPSRRRPVVSVPRQPPDGNLLVNSGFEETSAGTVGRLGERVQRSGWTYVFASASQSYIWGETDYVQHPQLGLPDIRSGKQALRTHTDGTGRTMVYQEVRVTPLTNYVAEAWVRAVDLHGKGFGRHPGDAVALVIQELSSSGGVTLEHPRSELRDPGSYRRLECRFRTGADTRRIRFILEAIQHAPYTEGHVTYDDCSLRPLR